MARSYTQRLRAEKSTQTRAAILAAARDLFAEADELKVDQIAHRAGVSVPTLYTHFESKGKLLSAVVGEISREVGLFAGFERVWRGHEGGGAPPTTVETAIPFLHPGRRPAGCGLKGGRGGPPVRGTRHQPG